MTKKKKILIIDDERVPVNFYVRALCNAGWEVEQCLNADLVLEVATKLQPDVIAIDISMPPGRSFAGTEAQGGRTTGVLLYWHLKDNFPSSLLVFITNLSEPLARALFDSKEVMIVLSKADTPPLNL